MSAKVELDAHAGTLERGLAILELLTKIGSASASSIGEQLGVSRSATYRILGVLRERGYVAWEDRAERVELGFGAINVGVAALSAAQPVVVGTKYLRQLADELTEAALLALRDGDEMVYVAHETGSQHSLAMRPLIGVRRHMHSTSLGKAYLAALPDSECEPLIRRLDLVRYTDTTITDVDALSREIAEIRRRGYATDNAENELGVFCVGAAVRDHRGRPVSSLSVAGPSERMRTKRDCAVDLVLRAATEMSRRLGYTPPTREN